MRGWMFGSSTQRYRIFPLEQTIKPTGETMKDAVLCYLELEWPWNEVVCSFSETHDINRVSAKRTQCFLFSTWLDCSPQMLAPNKYASTLQRKWREVTCSITSSVLGEAGDPAEAVGRWGCVRSEGLKMLVIAGLTCNADNFFLSDEFEVEVSDFFWSREALIWPEGCDLRLSDRGKLGHGNHRWHVKSVHILPPIKVLSIWKKKYSTPWYLVSQERDIADQSEESVKEINAFILTEFFHRDWAQVDDGFWRQHAAEWFQPAIASLDQWC